jgi:AraC-like DNA-binding protein
LTVAVAAKAAHMSPYHFHHMFKLAFNQTPMQFLQECRLHAACKLLTDTDKPVTAIAVAVNFQSLSSFSWLFRKRFGLSPRQFRNQTVRRADSQD